MNRTRFQTGCLAGVLALLLVACGGSGSTGLITAESALLAEVRETRECREANDTTYCFASVVEGMDTGVPDPSECSNVECPPSAAGGFTFDTAAVPAGATCAVATRSGDEDWTIGPLASPEADPEGFAVTTPPAFATGGFDAALLCFEEPPGELPPSVSTLADAGPLIIFVAPSL